MPLPQLVQRRLDADGPIRVGVIGAGKFASMFLNQVPFCRTSPSPPSPTSIPNGPNACRTRRAGARSGSPPPA